MTYSSDLIDSDLASNTSFLAPPAYPSIFGITFSPIVSGICLAVVGAGISGYLYGSFLKPQFDKNQELETKLSQTQAQIELRKENSKKIAEAQKNLERVNAQQQVITGLFASDKKLDTLLLDLNKLVNIRQGKLQRFKPEILATGSGSSGAAPITDGSLGAALNYKIKRKSVEIEVSGNFEQVQSILRTIERLDQLLVVKDFNANTETDNANQKILVDAQGKLMPRPEPIIKTTFKIQALIPMNPAEQAAAAPPPVAPKK
jgi:type IV pilus assembly protein PilO